MTDTDPEMESFPTSTEAENESEYVEINGRRFRPLTSGYEKVDLTKLFGPANALYQEASHAVVGISGMDKDLRNLYMGPIHAQIAAQAGPFQVVEPMLATSYRLGDYLNDIVGVGSELARSVQLADQHLIRGIEADLLVNRSTMEQSIKTALALQEQLATNAAALMNFTDGVASEALTDASLTFAAFDGVGESLDAVLNARFADLSLSTAALPTNDLLKHLTWTMAPSAYTSSAARALTPDVVEDDFDDARSDPWPTLSTDLSVMLNDIDPDLQRPREGAWEALESRNPDRWRHAGSSQRELIVHTLRALVPDDHPVMKGVKSPNRNHFGPRLRYLLRHDVDRQHVEAVDSVIGGLYGLLSSHAHQNHPQFRDDVALTFLLRAGESLLGYLLQFVDFIEESDE